MQMNVIKLESNETITTLHFMKAAYDQGHFTNQTWLFEKKGNFDPNEIKFKVVICFKAEIKTWDLIIDSKFSEPILSSAEARGKFFEANEGKRMHAPVNRHIWLKSGWYFSYKLFSGSFHVFGVSVWMTGDHKICSHIQLPLPKNTTYIYCPRTKPKPLIL